MAFTYAGFQKSVFVDVSLHIWHTINKDGWRLTQSSIAKKYAKGFVISLRAIVYTAEPMYRIPAHTHVDPIVSRAQLSVMTFHSVFIGSNTEL